MEKQKKRTDSLRAPTFAYTRTARRSLRSGLHESVSTILPAGYSRGEKIHNPIERLLVTVLFRMEIRSIDWRVVSDQSDEAK